MWTARVRVATRDRTRLLAPPDRRPGQSRKVLPHEPSQRRFHAARSPGAGWRKLIQPTAGKLTRDRWTDRRTESDPGQAPVIHEHLRRTGGVVGALLPNPAGSLSGRARRPRSTPGHDPFARIRR